MRTITYPITPAHAGMSVERYLKQEHGYSTRTLVKLKHYPQGLQPNGQHARTVHLLQAGDTLAVTLLDSQAHRVENLLRSNRRVEIPYEDDDLLVFNKPADMPCHQSCGHAADTLANVFAAHCDHLGLDLMYRPLNRLDRDTSGAALGAKNRFAAAKARRADKEHKYLTCKNCKTICRVPAGKGTIVITCPKCGHKIEGNS